MVVSSPPDGWVRVVAAGHAAGRPVALMFEYDGALVPHAGHPSAVRLDPGTRDTLAALAALPGVSVGVLSGRPLEEVRGAVGLPGLFYVGCGGCEMDLRGDSVTYPQADGVRRALDAVQGRLADVLRQYPGTWAERKPFGLTVHYRGVRPLAAACCLARVSDLLRDVPGLRRRDGAEAAELTPVGGWTRADALHRILARVGPGAVPVYAAAAPHDGEAFAAVTSRGGFAVAVGPEGDGGNARAASCDELPVQLAVLLRALSGRPAHRPSPGILVVDPDRRALDELSAALTGCGWVVWAETDPDAAVRLCEANRGAIHVALVDLQLPGFAGGRVLAEVGRLDPGVCRCAMSAAVPGYAAAAYGRLSDIPLFRKPFRAAAVEPALRALVRG